MKDMTSSVVARSLFSGIAEFVKLTSPMNQVNKFRNPVFVFHARDDSNVPFADAEKFVSQMKAAGKAIAFEQVPTGDHYQPMIDPAFPKPFSGSSSHSRSRLVKSAARESSCPVLRARHNDRLPISERPLLFSLLEVIARVRCRRAPPMPRRNDAAAHNKLNRFVDGDLQIDRLTTRN